MKGKKAKTISLEQLGRFEFRLSTGLCWRPINFLGFIMVCIFRRIPILGRCMLKYLGINVMMFALRFKENFLYYGWFTMLCQFLLRSKVTQFYIYVYIYVCVYIYKHSFLYYFKWFRKKGKRKQMWSNVNSWWIYVKCTWVFIILSAFLWFENF